MKVCDLTKLGISYDPISGEIKGRKNTVARGKYKSYKVISIKNKNYYAHRIAFLFMKGYLPENVDHIDNNGLNNKWSNLRELDPVLNRSRRAKGVFVETKKRKDRTYKYFVGQIKRNNTTYRTKCCHTLEEAQQEYVCLKNSLQ